MDRQELKSKVTAMSSRQELLELLNTLKIEDVGPTVHPFTISQLSYFCNPKNPKRFKVFTIPKKSGGKREISAPVEVLRSMLHYLNVALTSLYNPKQCVMGFTGGKSVVDNARVHVRQNYVLNIDLCNFFPSIEQARVWKRLQVKPYNLSVDVASAIAGLCSIECKNEDGSVKYVIPQGSPASPILTNMVCERLDYKLTKLAKNFSINYSRYADDMTFSSMHNVYQTGGEFITSLKSIIEEEHFKINDKKTRLQKKGARQEVTGLNVTCHANVTRKYVNWIRTILHIWEKYGFQEAYSKFYPKYKAENAYRRKGEPDLVNVLSGKLLYMKMVKGESDSTYKKLFERFNVLVESLNTSEQNFDGINYILSYTIRSFEKKYKAIIEQKEVDLVNSFGFFISDKWQEVKVGNNVVKEKFQIFLKKIHNSKKGQKLEGNYYISLCTGRDKRLNRKNNFWLVTNSKPRFIKGGLNISIDNILDLYNSKGIDEAISLIYENSSLISSSQRYQDPNYKSHTPKAMVSALYKFSQHNIIKWFTHKPDSNTIAINALLEMNKKSLYDILMTGSRHETINKRTWDNIKNFVLTDKKNCPLNAYGEVIKLSWGDDVVRQWCYSHPNEHPYFAEFEGHAFYSSINEFKHTIEFRTDKEDMTFRIRIKELIDELTKTKDLKIEYKDRFYEMEDVQLFTDVRLIFASIEKIIAWISDNNYKSKKVIIDVQNMDEFVELIITHEGSYLSIDNKKAQGLDGDFEELRLMLLAVADLRMEADHNDGKSYSLICLEKGYLAENYKGNENPAHMKNPCSKKELQDKVGGVKYYIRMYKNI